MKHSHSPAEPAPASGCSRVGVTGSPGCTAPGPASSACACKHVHLAVELVSLLVHSQS